MTTKIDDGGPAFPFPVPNRGPYGMAAGMSLRDWFAGQDIPTLINKSEDRDGGWDVHAVAAGAYAVADAMLAAKALPVLTGGTDGD